MLTHILCFLAGGLVVGAIIRSSPYEPDTLHERLADAAVKYCEYRRLNRMESFQRAAWDDYVRVTEEITTALHPEARRPAPPALASTPRPCPTWSRRCGRCLKDTKGCLRSLCLT